MNNNYSSRRDIERFTQSLFERDTYKKTGPYINKFILLLVLVVVGKSAKCSKLKNFLA